MTIIENFHLLSKKVKKQHHKAANSIKMSIENATTFKWYEEAKSIRSVSLV